MRPFRRDWGRSFQRWLPSSPLLTSRYSKHTVHSRRYCMHTCRPVQFLMMGILQRLPKAGASYRRMASSTLHSLMTYSRFPQTQAEWLISKCLGGYGTYIHTYILAYTHSCTYAHIHTCIYTLVHTRRYGVLHYCKFRVDPGSFADLATNLHKHCDHQPTTNNAEAGLNFDLCLWVTETPPLCPLGICVHRQLFGVPRPQHGHRLHGDTAPAPYLSHC